MQLSAIEGDDDVGKTALVATGAVAWSTAVESDHAPNQENHMKRVITAMLFALTAFLLTMAGTPTPAHAQATTTTTNVTFPFNTVIVNPCTGEPIAFTGENHFVIHTTATPSGTFQTTIHSNLQNVSGVGTVTGTTYRAVISNKQTTVFTAAGGQVNTIVGNFHIVGPGAGNNFILHNTVHVTVNPNGEATAEVENFFAECR
jgi:hypothetical protein